MKSMIRTVVCLSLLTAACCGTASSASAATSVYSSWNCKPGTYGYADGLAPYQTCDNVNGDGEQYWVQHHAIFYNNGITEYTGMCVKAQTAAGNTKDGSMCFDANHNYFGLPGTTDYRTADITTQPMPAARGYYYFGQHGNSYRNAGTSGSAPFLIVIGS